MRKYCKAYYLKDLRRFSNWTEQNDTPESALSDDDVVYLWDDFTVVKSPVLPDKGLVFDTITLEWQAFCKEALQFAIPEDLRYAYEQAEKEHDASQEGTEALSEVSV